MGSELLRKLDDAREGKLACVAREGRQAKEGAKLDGVRPRGGSAGGGGVS